MFRPVLFSLAKRPRLTPLVSRTRPLLRATLPAHRHAVIRPFTSAPQSSLPPQTSALKHLLSQYGKTALVLYLLISAADLGICYQLVKHGGSDFVLNVEEWISANITGGSFSLGGITHHKQQPEAHEVGEHKEPGFWATFAIAYAIHKLLVPIRVPITAAVTPMTARWLKRRGWMEQVVIRK